MGYEAFGEVDGCAHFFLVQPEGEEPVPSAVTILAAALVDQPETFEQVPTDARDTAVIL